MKAAIVRADAPGFSLGDAQLATPIGREVLVHVKASGLCHTDLAISQGPGPTPAVLGHEVAGVVAALGPAAESLAVGDHVVGCLVQSCGQCVACLTGRSFQCERPEELVRGAAEPPRISIDGEPAFQLFGLGGFAQQALIHENQLVKLDERVPFPQAALLGCGVVTGAGAVINSSNTQAGDSIVIIGAGGVGLNAISGAVIAGARTIIAIDVTDAKLEKARQFGATHTVNSRTSDAVAEVMAITSRGVDAAFDFVGLPEISRSAIDMLRMGGGLYVVGGAALTSALEVPYMELLLGQKRVQGVFMGSSTPRRDIPFYADLYLQGRYKLDELISKEISLGDVDAGFASLEEPNSARVVITSGLS